MNIYKISQNENTNYDTFDSAVVAAPTEKAARNVNPGEYFPSTWCSSPDKVTVELIGTAKRGTKAGIILSSFNAS